MIALQQINHQVAGIDDVMRAGYQLAKAGVRGFAPEQDASYPPRRFPPCPESLCVWGGQPGIPEFCR